MPVTWDCPTPMRSCARSAPRAAPSAGLRHRLARGRADHPLAAQAGPQAPGGAQRRTQPAGRGRRAPGRRGGPGRRRPTRPRPGAACCVRRPRRRSPGSCSGRHAVRAAGGRVRSDRRCRGRVGARDALVSLLGAGRHAVPGLGGPGPGRDHHDADPATGTSCARRRSTTPCTGSPSTGTCVEAAVQACALTRDVQRPDLLLVGALLHDIGKGRPGRDHTEVGIELVAEIAPRLGFDPDDSRRARGAVPLPPAAGRDGHPPRPRRSADHRHGRRRAGQHRAARPAARA